MFELKPITKESIPRALAKAERYRLLGEPFQAESICRDVLAVDTENQAALACLILALTDMFSQTGATGEGTRVEDVGALTRRLTGPYERVYYDGVVKERWARALLLAGYPPASVYELFRAAMRCFEEAQGVAPAANDDAVLRWNACVRVIERYRIEPADGEDAEPVSLDDDVPFR